MLLVCLLVFLAGYVDAIAGGGGLISLPAYMIAGLPTHAAIATNKMSSTMGTTIATWHYAKSGYIQWKLAGVCVVLAVAGSTIGSNLVLITSDAFLRVFLLAVLPITAIYVMRPKRLRQAGQRAAFSETHRGALRFGGVLRWHIRWLLRSWYGHVSDAAAHRCGPSEA